MENTDVVGNSAGTVAPATMTKSRQTEAMHGISTALVAALLFMTMAHAVWGQSPVPSPSKTAVTANGLVADFYQPAEIRGPLPALIVLGGSRGGLDERTAWEATALVERGYAVLHLAYIVGPGLPTSARLPTAIHLIPLEYFKTAIDWLRSHPAVDSSRIGIVGTSIGGMAALLVAAHYPDLKVVLPRCRPASFGPRSGPRIHRCSRAQVSPCHTFRTVWAPDQASTASLTTD